MLKSNFFTFLGRKEPKVDGKFVGVYHFVSSKLLTIILMLIKKVIKSILDLLNRIK